MTRISIDIDNRPVLRQELAVGGELPGWHGPAVTGGCRGVGSVVVADPRLEIEPAPPTRASLQGRSAVLALPGPAVQVVAPADDAVSLRRLLDSGVAPLGY